MQRAHEARELPPPLRSGGGLGVGVWSMEEA
jgi:hypothetical protein